MTIKKKWTAVLSGFVLAIGIAGCGNSDDNAQENEEANNNQEEQQSEEGNNNSEEGNNSEASGDTAAVVNGEEISMDEFTKQVDRQKNVMQQNGMEMKDKQLAQIKQRILSQLINTELLLQKANDAGIEATQEKVDEKYNQMTKDYSEEKVTELLKQNNTTKEQLKKDLANQIKIDEFVAQNTEEVSVSDKEIQERYDSMKQNNKEMPSLDKVKSTLKQQIKKSKKNEQVSKLLDELRKESEIEKNVQA